MRLPEGTLGMMLIVRGVEPVVTPSTGAVQIDRKFEALRALAARVIHEHANDEDLCTVCGSAFPCELAVLAEHNLDLV